MGELLEFILYTVIIIYAIRMVLRLVLPMLFQKVVNKAAQQGQQNYYSQSSAKKPNGSINVDHIPQDVKKHIPDSEGEFVDYEEIK